MSGKVRNVMWGLGFVAAVAVGYAIAQQTDDKPPAGGISDNGMQLPPGMTEEMMKAMMEAGTPGPMHTHLCKAAGEWKGKVQCWMAADGEPSVSECKAKMTPLLDGRFIMCEVEGDMGGMPFKGVGIYGYDNVAKKFQSVWIDSMGTGMATATGELAADGKMLTWTCSYNCPIAKKEVTMKQIERYTDNDNMTLEFHGSDPQGGPERRMMLITYTRTRPATR